MEILNKGSFFLFYEKMNNSLKKEKDIDKGKKMKK